MKNSQKTILFSLGLVLAGCRSTYMRFEVSENPLPRIAEQAMGEYSVTQLGESTLHLRNTNPAASIFTLGWYTFHAELHYSKPTLEARFYTRAISPFFLFIPVYGPPPNGTSPLGTVPLVGIFFGRSGSQVDELLAWAGLHRPERVESIFAGFPKEAANPKSPP